MNDLMNTVIICTLMMSVSALAFICYRCLCADKVLWRSTQQTLNDLTKRIEKLEYEARLRRGRSDGV